MGRWVDCLRLPMLIVHVNGEEQEAPDAGRNLLSYLRFDLGLTGTKYGCGEGLCGSCTVLVDGQPLRACMATVASVAGGSVTTIEGLAQDGKLHPVQQAFIAENSPQCGFCTPGQVMSAVALLNSNPRPTKSEAAAAMSGNLCRCGAYEHYLNGVMRASGQLS